MIHPFEALRSEYESYVATIRPNPDRAAEIESVAKRLTQPSSLGRYAQVEARIGVPQVVQATICEREDGNDFTKNPAQGDPWDRPSVHVPKGRGPFTSWVEAAIDAFHVCDHLDDNSAPWSLPYACWKWEGYNGFGYRAHGVHSPYVVGGTNLQQPGKYIGDGEFDPNHIDTQLGCLPIAMKMIELVPSLALGTAVAAVISPAVLPTPAPAPEGVANALFIQQSLNKLGFGPLIEDGSYGRLTRAAVRQFQIAQGLAVDGLAGPLTLTAINSSLKV